MINRQQLFTLMNEAGFSTDWTGYEDARETISKYERFAELIENNLRAQCFLENEMKHLAQHNR